MPRRPAPLALALPVFSLVISCGAWSEYNRQSYGDAAGQAAIAALGCAFQSCPHPQSGYAILRARVREATAFTNLPVQYTRVLHQQSGHEVAAASTSSGLLVTLEAVFSLVEDGELVDSGKRKSGRIVWMVAPTRH